MYQIDLPYLSGRVCDVTTSPAGYTEAPGAQAYYRARVRNVYIIRVDLLYCLTDYFKVETIEKYRSILYMLIAGHPVSDNELISKFLEMLYKEDEIFRFKFSEIVYFKEPEFDKYSIYDTLLIKLRRHIEANGPKLYEDILIQKHIVDDKLMSYLSVRMSFSRDVISTLKGVEIFSL